MPATTSQPTKGASLAPTWRATSDLVPSLAISALVFDADAVGTVLYAGTGSRSSYRMTGGAPVGLLRSTDAGESWALLPGSAVLCSSLSTELEL